MSEELKNKIHQYEAPPPAEVWKNISSELRESNEFLPLSAKMYEYQVTPPDAAWSNISQRLRSDITGRDRSKVIRINPIVWKFGIAAVLVGLIILSGLFYINGSSTRSKDVADHNPQRPETPSHKRIWLDPSITAGSLMDAASALSALKNTDSYVSNTSNEETVNEFRRPLHKVQVNASFTSTENISVPARPILDSRGEVILSPKIVLSDDGQHIDITAPNGQQTRISSKFMYVLLYLNADETDQYEDTHLESEVWQKKFDDWRRKIMQNSFIPSSSNFFDIMELKELLSKENQQ